MARPSRIQSFSHPLIGRMEGYLLSLGYQPKSASLVAWQLAWFLWWLGDQRLEEVTVRQLRAYRVWLQQRPSYRDGGPLSQKTIYGYERAVRLLLDYLLDMGELNYDPCSEWHVDYPQCGGRRKVLSQLDIQLLYQACQNIGERLIMALAYGCGLRASELERLNLEDVNLSEKRLLVRRGKNAKRRMVPLSEGVVRELSRRVSWYGNRAFLAHNRGGRMLAYTANKRLKSLADRAGLSTTTSLHVLRHSIATHLLENGMAIDQVRLFLGHGRAVTTEVYTHISSSQLRRLLP